MHYIMLTWVIIATKLDNMAQWQAVYILEQFN